MGEGDATVIHINITENIRQAIGSLDATFAKQVPFATSLAITKTAQDIPAAMGREAGSVFDRPRPFTTGAGAMYVKSATKHSLTAEAGYKDIQSRYLKWQIGGGDRVQKGFERALAGMGMLPAGYLTTPGEGIKLDAFGNIPRAQIIQILGQLKSGASVFKGRGKYMTRSGLFVVFPGATDPRVRHLTPGVWERYGNGHRITPLIHYVDAAAYRPRLDIAGTARRVVDARFPAHFEAAWQQARATAK
jgi:hypothetical protein